MSLRDNVFMKKLILLLSLLTSNLWASPSPHLTLYFIPSPGGIDWSSPANLAWSALSNRLSFKSRFMGHVFVEMQCGEKKELTGMVGKNFDYLRQLLIENRGLGILYHSFEGALEDQAEIEKELAELSQTGERLNFVRFKINDKQCQRLSTYLSEYRSKNVGRFYGLANRPLYGEGAGCSAFGVSFIDVLGLLDQDFKDAWSQTVNIPLEFAGPPLKDQGVNLVKLMLNAGSWAKDSGPHQKLTFWDPDRMYKWVNEQGLKIGTVIELGKSKGIELDRSYLPAPEGPIWQQHLDPNYRTTKK